MKTTYGIYTFNVALVILVSSFTQPLAAEELYKWVDERGRVTYQSSPPPESAVKVDKSILSNEIADDLADDVAVADTGLEYGMCFFHDPGEPVIPQSVTPPGTLTVQPAHRKLVAVNGTSGNALQVDDSFRHGTHVAASVAGDSAVHPVSPVSAGHDHGDQEHGQCSNEEDDLEGLAGQLLEVLLLALEGAVEVVAVVGLAADVDHGAGIRVQIDYALGVAAHL